MLLAAGHRHEGTGTTPDQHAACKFSMLAAAAQTLPSCPHARTSAKHIIRLTDARKFCGVAPVDVRVAAHRQASVPVRVQQQEQRCVNVQVSSAVLQQRKHHQHDVGFTGVI